MAYFIAEENQTLSTDMPKVVRLMLARKKLVSDLTVTSGLEFSEAKIFPSDEEFIDEKHIEMVTKARQEYRKGEVISEKELFKRLNEDAKRDE